MKDEIGGLTNHPNLPRQGTIALLRAALRMLENRNQQRVEDEIAKRLKEKTKKGKHQ
jgi:hypothetical protein